MANIGRWRPGPPGLEEATVRLSDKVALVMGGGQTKGQTIGNGRATAVLFAREGARVAVVDRDKDAAEETVEIIAKEGGEAWSQQGDVTDEAAVAGVVEECVRRWGRIDVLHNNVGVSIAGGDAPVTGITGEALDRILSINLKGMVFACKHVVPVMQAQRSGAITNISSNAVLIDYPYVGYKTSKSAVIALTEQLAITYAPDGIRANTILPGLMNTPMAIENRAARWGVPREEVVSMRDAEVPLRHKMGTAWDVAHAALYLASDEAGFVTGAVLTVDGGQSLQAGWRTEQMKDLAKNEPAPPTSGP
jgi:NAD(P)-dependent dehydrogenase (short-subunit alcohol dehydrogenase family)